MNVICKWCETEYRLAPSLHLQSIGMDANKISAWIQQKCPKCGQTEYMTLHKKGNIA